MAHPRAGQPAQPEDLVDLPHLVTAYYAIQPDPDDIAQQVAFGTSGHRGSSLLCSFNEAHILAITQAICLYRRRSGIDGPLYLGMDTHALSEPAFASALEVLAANAVEVMIAEGTPYTPTPAVSHAILCYNCGRKTGLADGIVITPSHNPPESGGFKYNPPSGGPADPGATTWIEAKANELIAHSLKGVKRIALERAMEALSTHRHDYLRTYVEDLGSVIDLEAVRGAGIRMGVDPLGGAGVHYWPAIAERYRLSLQVTNDAVDPTFRFMTVDWDGRIRMDPSSSYAMQGLIGLKDRFDVAFACDTDHDRHGIVTRCAGLLPPNHYLTSAASYLFRNRPHWLKGLAIGKTVVTSVMIDRVAVLIGCKVFETPVGFKWFVDGLLHGSLGFAGEESAGASLLRRNGRVWTTDKDGIVLALLAPEMMARTGHDPAELYATLTRDLGDPAYERVEAPASALQRRMLTEIDAQDVRRTQLAGEAIVSVLTRAPANGEPIGGVKLVTESGWFAARPSGTESICKVYGESLRGAEHLRSILEEGQAIIGEAVAAAMQRRPVEQKTEQVTST